MIGQHHVVSTSFSPSKDKKLILCQTIIFNILSPKILKARIPFTRSEHYSPRVEGSIPVRGNFIAARMIYLRKTLNGHHFYRSQLQRLCFYTCLSVLGGSASVHAGIPPSRIRHPPEQTPPRADTPRADTSGADTPGTDTP